MRKSVAKGLLAGAAAGVVAGIAMQVFDDLWQKRHPEPSYENDITRSMALTAAQRLGVRLSDAGVECAARAIHLAIGIALGAGYGLAVELMPRSAAAAGVPFFVGEAVLGNEVIGPRLGLFRPPSEYPAGKHWNSVLTHVVYGAVTELVRREVRGRL